MVDNLKKYEYYRTDLGVLYHADCLQIMPQLEPVDLVLTSPPYDNLRVYGGHHFDFENIAEKTSQKIKMGGVIVWVVGDATINGSETCTSFKHALFFKGLGLNLHDTMIYNKGSTPCYDPRNKRYKDRFEYMFVFSKGKPTVYNPIKDERVLNPGVNKKATSRKQNGSMRRFGDIRLGNYQDRGNIWVIKNGWMKTTTDKYAYNHPAMFPESLSSDHIVSWSNEGDTVADIMCGSGTTCKMAEKLNRKWIGIEIEEKYCEIAANRIENERKQLKLF